MTYWNRVLSRVLTPGFALVALGMLAVCLAGVFTRQLPDEERRQRTMLIKMIGTAVVAVGALIVFLTGK